LAGLWAIFLSWRLFVDGEKDEFAVRRAWAAESAVALLAVSPAYILFCRQSRYYALGALGTVMVLRSWRRLLEHRPWGALAVAASLQMLLHSSFAFFAAAVAALTLDALLRLDECPRAGRFWLAAFLTTLFAFPAFWYFRFWERPGNHTYGWAESLEFLKTMLMWLSAFSVPLLIVAASYARRWVWVLGGFILLCGIVGEGTWSRMSAVCVCGAILVMACIEPAPYGVMNLRRMCLLLVTATLALLSWGAAEPYGRYLVSLMPAIAYLIGRSISLLGRGRPVLIAVLTILVVGGNIAFLPPLKAAQEFGAPSEPVVSVSGMMRQRLRDLPWRSDAFLVTREIFWSPTGYIEPIVDVMRARGGATFFSDADNLSLMFATLLRPVYPNEFLSSSPDWIVPSTWLSLSPDLRQRVQDLAASGQYEAIPVLVPQMLWQNNPDPLFRTFSPRQTQWMLLRRKY
jgi:hypothetical protein